MGRIRGKVLTGVLEVVRWWCRVGGGQGGETTTVSAEIVQPILERPRALRTSSRRGSSWATGGGSLGPAFGARRSLPLARRQPPSGSSGPSAPPRHPSSFRSRSGCRGRSGRGVGQQSGPPFLFGRWFSPFPAPTARLRRSPALE